VKKAGGGLPIRALSPQEEGTAKAFGLLPAEPPTPVAATPIEAPPLAIRTLALAVAPAAGATVAVVVVVVDVEVPQPKTMKDITKSPISKETKTRPFFMKIPPNE
jgi:hypothetical protein